MADPKWLELAKRELGTKEVAGNQDNPSIMQYYADAGFPDIDHDEVAWCAAFTNAMLKRSGLVGTRSLAARSFEKYGQKLDAPKPGCIVVFPRGNPKGWQGHVGIVSEVGDGVLKVLGGNQSDKVCVQTYPTSKALAFRWPKVAEPKKPAPDTPVTVPELSKVSTKVRTIKNTGSVLHAIWMSVVGLLSLENVGFANGAVNDIKTLVDGLALPGIAVMAIGGVLLGRYLISRIVSDIAEGRYTPSGG